MAQEQEFYKGTDFDTVKKLEMRCQTSENNLTAKLLSLVLAENDGEHGTLATYETVSLGDMKIGLVFSAYNTDGEVRLIEARLASEGHTKMFRTTALIGDARKKITVFRNKQR